MGGKKGEKDIPLSRVSFTPFQPRSISSIMHLSLFSLVLFILLNFQVIQGQEVEALPLTKWITAKPCSQVKTGCCCDPFVTRTQKKSVTSTKTLGLVTVTKTITVDPKPSKSSLKSSSKSSVKVTSTKKLSTTAPKLLTTLGTSKATTTKKALLEARALRCQVCPKNTLLTKSVGVFKTSTCCQPASTKTISQVSTKIITTSLKTKRTTTKVITVTRKTTSIPKIPTKSTGIVTKRTPYKPHTESLYTTTRSHSGKDYTLTSTSPKTKKPTLTAKGLKPKVTTCKTSPSAGYVQIGYPNGIKVTPAIYIPKGSDAFTCDLTTKVRLVTSISISINPSFYGTQVDWILKGNVTLSTGRSPLGLGLVTFEATDESFGNVTNSITIPATSLSKTVSGVAKRINVLKPKIQDLVGVIKAYYDFSTTGKTLGIDQVPTFVWQALKVPTPYTQQQLTSWITTTLKLTDKPNFNNGFSGFSVEFKPSSKSPFEAIINLHNVVSALKNSFVSSSISGVLQGKPGSWNLPKPCTRALILRTAKHSISITVPVRNAQDLCRLKLPAKVTGSIKHIPRLHLPDFDVKALLTNLVCQKGVVVSWQASWNLVTNLINLTPPELAGLANDTNPIHSGRVMFDSLTGTTQVNGIVKGLAVKLAPKQMVDTAANLRPSSGYYPIEWAFDVLLDLSKPEPVTSIKVWVATKNITQADGIKEPWVSLAMPESRICHQGSKIVPCMESLLRNTPDLNLWPLHSTGRHILKTSPKQAFEAWGKALIGNLTVVWSPKSLLFTGTTQISHSVYSSAVNLTIPLAKDKVGLGKLGFNISVSEHSNHLGYVAGVTTKWPCNNIHPGSFNFSKIPSTQMYLAQAGKFTPTTILDSKLFNGQSNVSFSCTPQGEIKFMKVLGTILDFSTKLYDDAATVKFAKATFEFLQGYSKLHAVHSRTNRNITFYLPNHKNKLPYLGDPKPIWSVEGLNRPVDLNNSLVDFLGSKAAIKFRQYFDNSTSRLIHHTWKRPGASNITIGYSRTGNKTFHDSIFFSNTRVDPLVGKPVWKNQRLSTLSNVQPWSLKPSAKQWTGPPEKLSGEPIKYQTQNAVNLTGISVGFPPHHMIYPSTTRRALEKRQATSSSTTTTTVPYTYATFTTGTGTWVAPTNVLSVDVLVIGGGGGGGNGYDTGGGGGGAAGMFIEQLGYIVNPGVSYTYIVGAGGLGGGNSQTNLGGQNGSSSSFGAITALGGLGGKGSRSATVQGLGGSPQSGTFGNYISAQPGQGGGNGATAVAGCGGGGGGSFGAGSNGASTGPGQGGAGTVSQITGNTYGLGGSGGKGNYAQTGASGPANSGTGGAGGSSVASSGYAGGNGGSGLVVLRFKPAQATTTTSISTYSIPTFTNVASSNISASNNVLHVATNGFAYEWIFGNNNMTASFAGAEVCPPQLQQVLMSGSLPAFGSLQGFAGTGSFICSAGNDSEPISFATQASNSSAQILPINTYINLINATMQVNCVPDADLCFWPSVLVGSPLYGFSNAMNGTSYWDSLNATQLLVNAQANASLSSAQQQSTVQSIVANNSAWSQAIQQVGNLRIPNFLLQDPFALSLLAEGLYNVPVASYQCNNTVTYTCDTPTVIMSGIVNTTQPQVGSLLMYGSIFSTSASGSTLDRQTLAASFNGFGAFAVNFTQDICSGPVTSVSYLLSNITNNLPTLSGTNGTVAFNCQQGQIVTWNFTVPIGTAQTNVTLNGVTSSFTIQNGQLVYFADTDYLGTQATYNGITHLVATQPNSYNTSNFLQSSSSTPNSLSSLATTPSPFQASWQQIFNTIPTAYGSFNLSTIVDDFSATYNGTLSNGTVNFQVGFNDQVGPVTINSFVAVELYQSNFGGNWTILNDTGSITITFAGDNYVELEVAQLPCKSNPTGSVNVTGIVNVNLPGIGSLNGNVAVSFVCALPGTNQTWSDVNFVGTFTGPITVQILGGVLVVESLVLSYDTASGLMSVTLDMMNADISVSYDFAGNASYLNNVYINVPGPISPFNTSLPFSDLWTNALGNLETSQLANEVLIDPLIINYQYAPPTNVTGDSFTLQGNFIAGDVDANIYLALQQIQPGNSTMWFLQTADFQLVVNNQIIVSIAGSSPCQVGVESVNVTLQNFGPFINPAFFQGNVILSCNANNSISAFYINASATNIPMTVLGSTEYLSAAVSYDSTSKVLLVSGGPTNQDWSLNFMVDFATNVTNSTTNNSSLSTTWSLSVGTTEPLSWSEIPFSNGMDVAFTQTGSSQLQNVSGVTLQSFNFLYNSSPESFNLSASVGESFNGLSAGQGLIIDMAKVNGSWTLLDAAFTFDTVFTIGDIGVVSLNGTLSCPNGNVNGLASIGGVPAMQMTIQAAASVSYVCRQYFNISISLANLEIGVGGETLQLTQVGLNYSNLTNIMTIQGNMIVQNANVAGFATVSLVIQVAHNQTKTGLVSIFVDLGVGSQTTLYNSGLPISGFLNAAVSGTQTQPVTPNALMLNLNYTYYAPTTSNLATMNFLGYIQDGSYSGSFLMNLDQIQVLVPGIVNGSTTAVATNRTTWVASLVEVNVTLANYGTVSIYGTDPCPNGQLDATANLTLPNVGNQQILGAANFVCNSTRSIMYWTLEAQDVWTITIDGDAEVFNGTVLYSSQDDSLDFTADWDGVANVFFNYNGTKGQTNVTNSTWDIGIQIVSPVGFGSLPFVSTMNGALSSSGSSLTNPPTTGTGFEIASGLIEFSTATPESLIFQVSVAGQTNSFSGSGFTNLELAKVGGNWTVTQLEFGLSLDIDNIAVVSLSVEPLCPQAQGQGSVIFTNLPLSIPTFGLNATVQFGCTASGVNTSDYAITATLDEPTALNFLGEQININGMSLSYNSTQDYFVFNWQPVSGFNMTLEFGNGLKSGQKQSGPPFNLYAIYEPSTTPPGALTALGQMLPSFGSSMDNNSFVNPQAAPGETSVSGDVNSIQLNWLYLDFDAVGYSISLSCDVQFYSVAADFVATLAKTSGGSWEALIGVQIVAVNQMSSPYGWMNSMAGSGSTLDYAQINFYLSTSAGTYVVGDPSTSVTTMGTGLLISALLELDSGPIQNITGGANNTSPANAGAGTFGVAVNSASPDGTYLYVTFEITTKYFALILDLNTDITAMQNQGTSPTSFTDLQLVVWADLKSFELTFEFATIYTTNYGGTDLVFGGAIGLVIGDLGASVVATFFFNGGWNDPLGLSPYLTVSYIDLQISLDLEDGIPDAVDLACQVVMVDPVTVSTAYVSAALYLDLESLLQNSAIGFSMTDFSLATIVNLFWQSVPDWLESMLESFSIGSLVVSFNPSTTSTSFPNPIVTQAPVIPPGLIVNATNVDIFNFLYMDYAYLDITSQGLSAGVALHPINYSPLFAVTSATNPNQGPSGSLVLNSQEFAFDLDGSITLLGETWSVDLTIFVDWQSFKTQSFLNATWSYYEDRQMTLLVEETDDPTFGFGLVWAMYTYNSQGFFAAIFDGWEQTIQGVMQNVQSSVINSVNAQCQSAIASANRQLAQAQLQLQIAEDKANAAINAAEQKVDQAQQQVNNMQSTCQNLHNHCGWQFWNCIAFGFCEVGYGVATGVLWLASEVLQGTEAVADAAIAAAEGVVSATQVVVDGVITAAEDLVDGVMIAITWVLDNVFSLIADAVGWLFNLQSIIVGGMFNIANQESFLAEITVGFFGTAPRTYGFYLDVNNVDSVVSACVWFGQPAMNNWFNGQLSGSPAAAYQAQISQAMVQSSAAAVEVMGMSPADMISPPIGPSNGSTIFQGVTFTNAQGTGSLVSPSNIATLTMDQNCKVFVQMGTTIGWSTGTNSPNTTCALQILPSGNVVLQNQATNVTLWQSNTAGTNASLFYIADDGNVYLTDMFGDIFWSSASSPTQLLPGLSLTDGTYTIDGVSDNFIQEISSGQCSTVWGNGLEVARQSDTPTGMAWVSIWNTGAGNGAPYAFMNNGSNWLVVDGFGVTIAAGGNPDCNGACIVGFVASSGYNCELAYMNLAGTVVYDWIYSTPPCTPTLGNGQYLYQTTKLCGSNGNYLILQSDNNLVYYTASGGVIWASNTNGGSGVYYLIMQTDNNLVLYDSNNSPHWASGTSGKGTAGQAYLSIAAGGALQIISGNSVIWQVDP